MKEMMIILFSAILTENFILAKFMGICPFLGVSKKLDSAVGMSVAVTFVMAMATAVTWPIYTYLLVPNGLDYLQTVVFILVIAALVQLVEIILKKYVPALHKSLGIYLPLITTNCAVLGVTMLNISKELNFAESMVNAVGAGLLPAGHGAVLRRAAAAGGHRHPRVLQRNPHHIDRGFYRIGILYGIRRPGRRPV